MKMVDLYKSPGTYVSVSPVHSTKAYIQDWLFDSEIPNPLSLDDLHVTLLYSRVTVPVNLSTNELKARPKKFEIFTSDGLNALVIVLDSPEIAQRHQQFRRLGATHDYPYFTPHLTVSYDVGNFDTSVLELPNFQMVFCGEHTSALDD